MVKTTADPVPEKVNGLPTSGPLGTEPTLTVGGIVGAGTLILGALSAYFGWEPPGDVRGFFDEWGIELAGMIVAILTAAASRMLVFSPRAVGEIVNEETVAVT